MIQLGGGIMIWRCTEAVDPRAGHTFRTIGNPDGRCVEIVAPNNTMLMDRRLARKVAETILELCGPETELESDIAQADLVEIVYGPDGDITGFAPYAPRNGSQLADTRAFIEKVRAEKGLPPSSLFDYPASSVHG